MIMIIIIIIMADTNGYAGKKKKIANPLWVSTWFHDINAIYWFRSQLKFWRGHDLKK